MTTRQIHEVPPWVERESSLTKSLNNVQMSAGRGPVPSWCERLLGEYLGLVCPPRIQGVTTVCN
ncbi:hypothetical protein CP881_08715 [Cutibacterium acnes]|nr:hypothetical protein CP876_02740 [Cutibacterium acnes]REB79009.1 hypothetical protein CP882_04025 [Cutibacterium acnes]REB80743.1 hypothetical protein CP881_08715 [Cutibacterium acnes]TLG48730.1 hypothetical protein FD505_08695 [Cutibacterium acnes]TLG51744.1 hypothetical protein FD506_04015 [Cutibacterium acnes]